MSPCHTGWVATSAVAVATAVSFTLGTHAAKCSPSRIPAAAQVARVRRYGRVSSRRSSRRRPSAAGGTSAALAKALRQKAMASPDAAA